MHDNLFSLNEIRGDCHVYGYAQISSDSVRCVHHDGRLFQVSLFGSSLKTTIPESDDPHPSPRNKCAFVLPPPSCLSPPRSWNNYPCAAWSRSPEGMTAVSDQVLFISNLQQRQAGNMNRAFHVVMLRLRDRYTASCPVLSIEASIWVNDDKAAMLKKNWFLYRRSNNPSKYFSS